MRKKPSLKVSKKATFPLSTDKSILKDLKNEAQEQNISLNAKINDVLTNYVLWYRNAEDQESIVIPNKNFQFMLDHLDDKDLLKNIITNTLNLDAYFRSHSISYTLHSLIKYGCEGAGLGGGLFHGFSYYRDVEGYSCLLLEHNYGIKWSRILADSFSHMITSMLNYHTTVSVLPDSVTVRIVERNVEDIPEDI